LAALGREVVKTICDVPGDQVRRIRSVASTWGSGRASKLAVNFFFTAAAISMLPYITGRLGTMYLAAVAPAIFMFAWASLSIAKNASGENAKRVKRIALVGMALGLAAFIVGGLA